MLEDDKFVVVALFGMLFSMVALLVFLVLTR
jgi:hypothetical protein